MSYKLDKENIVTIDIEGDALSASRNKQVFPTGNHFDPETRIWCITVTERRPDSKKLHTHTYVKKLPDEQHVRKLPSPWYEFGKWHDTTVAYHDKQTKVETMFSKYVQEYDTYHSQYDYSNRTTSEYIAESVEGIIRNLDHAIIICKGYHNKEEDKFYNYDRMCLENAMSKHISKDSPFANVKLSNIFYVIDNNPLGSSKQISPCEWEDNQSYLNAGIKHNIEDSIKLNNWCYDNWDNKVLPQLSKQLKKLQTSNRINQIEQDFASTDTLSVS